MEAEKRKEDCRPVLKILESPELDREKGGQRTYVEKREAGHLRRKGGGKSREGTRFSAANAVRRKPSGRNLETGEKGA